MKLLRIEESTRRHILKTFRQGRTLQESTRQYALRIAGTMNYIRIWRAIKAFATGQVGGAQNRSGPSFFEVVHAWLIVGQEHFGKILKVIGLVRSAVQRGLKQLEEFVTQVQAIFPDVSAKKLAAEVERTRLEFCLSGR